MKSIQTRSYIGIIFIVILFIGLNTISNQMFRRNRLDLTQEKIYSLSEASREIIKGVKEPLTFKYFYSATDGASIPSFKAYGERVMDFLASYAQETDQIRLEIYDPRPDSEEAEWAEKYGLNAVQAMGGDVLFCGMVVLDEKGHESCVPFFDASREEFLEYDISKIIVSLSNSKKAVLGIYSSLPIEGLGMAMPGRQPDESSDPWFFLNELKETYDVRMIPDLSEIPSEISCLLLMHPKGLSNQAQYALDQYLLSGKSAFILVDTMCEADNVNPQAGNPMMPMNMNRSSELPLTLRKSGFSIPEGKVVLDRDLATQVQTAPGQSGNFYAWLSLTSKQINREDAITGKLETMIFPSTGSIQFDSNKFKDIRMETLIQSSATACMVDGSVLLFGGSMDAITSAYVPGAAALPLAVRISGKVQTAFPDGKPKEEAADKVAKDKEKTDAVKEKPDFLKESAQPVNIILVSDVDFLSNRFSVNVMNLFGNMIVTPINDNINFLYNSLESLSGSKSLTAIRSRGKFTRPFTRVAEIEARAQTRWLMEEKQLQAKVDEFSGTINSLMKQEEGKQVLKANKEVMEQIRQIRTEKLITQKKLKEVQKNLRQDKESLGTQLFLFNTFLVPFMILLYGLYRLLMTKKLV